jgi:hypothetical protein
LPTTSYCLRRAIAYDELLPTTSYCLRRAIAYDEQQSERSWREEEQRKQKTEAFDGSYLLKSSRNDLSAEDIWRSYIPLTRVEAAFRSMKSPTVRAAHLPSSGATG